MSRFQLKDNDRRALLWGALAVLLWVVVTYGVRPYRATLADTQEQLEFERDGLVRERSAIAAAQRNPALQRLADSLMQRMTGRLFTGVDDVMASAELGSYLGEVASQHHVLLTTATTGAVPKTRSPVRTLSEDIRGESDLHGLLEFLQALERGPKLLRVARLDISRPTRDADDIETILFSATVTAYALAPETPSSNGLRRASDTTTVERTDAGGTGPTSAWRGDPR